MTHDRKKKIKQSLKIIASREGIAEYKVRDEIARAVSYALKSNDPEMQHFWQDIPCEGTAPTIDEIVDFLVEKIAEEDT